MAILLLTVAVAFAAFCVWLTVRIVNRRERWAKWTLAAVVGVPVLYVASFGPAAKLASDRYETRNLFMQAYSPILDVATEPFTDTRAKRMLRGWAECCGGQLAINFATTDRFLHLLNEEAEEKIRSWR